MKFFWEAFVTLFVISDPPGIVPVFLGLTRIAGLLLSAIAIQLVAESALAFAAQAP